ncbi:hypothetical protein ACSFA3_05715 [Variovorax sp. RHLX14]|uniref:hypothetical protein n=1 Tax=Variovorax sp. RHLX14 TaxID=1259731 RepID=UPI003F448D67
MQTHSTPPPKQVLLRLPEDLAARLNRAVPPRKRNKFLVDLVRRELEKEDAELIAACEAMNRMETANPGILAETDDWLNADLTGTADDWDTEFDAEKFSREAAIAQARRK